MDEIPFKNSFWGNREAGRHWAPVQSVQRRAAGASTIKVFRGSLFSACGTGINKNKFLQGRFVICGLGKKTASEPEDAKKAKNKRNGKHCFGTI